MKVSESATPNKQKEASGSRKQSNKNCGGDKNGSNQTQPGRTLKVNNCGVPSQNIVSLKIEASSKPVKSDGTPVNYKTKGDSPTSVKKPWIPCTRRPSKPKPPPAILEMELSLVDPDKICKKFPKAPSPDTSDTDKSVKTSICKTPTITSSDSIIGTDRRTKVVLKRQFALDKAISNSKESISDESLTSINSVTQLLKLERSAFVLKNKKQKCAENDDDEEIVTGVKLLAARLQAKHDAHTQSTVGSGAGVIRKANEYNLNNSARKNDERSNSKPRSPPPITNKVVKEEKRATNVVSVVQHDPKDVNVEVTTVAESKPSTDLSSPVGMTVSTTAEQLSDRKIITAPSTETSKVIVAHAKLTCSLPSASSSPEKKTLTHLNKSKAGQSSAQKSSASSPPSLSQSTGSKIKPKSCIETSNTKNQIFVTKSHIPSTVAERTASLAKPNNQIKDTKVEAKRSVGVNKSQFIASTTTTIATTLNTCVGGRNSSDTVRGRRLPNTDKQSDIKNVDAPVARYSTVSPIKVVASTLNSEKSNINTSISSDKGKYSKLNAKRIHSKITEEVEVSSVSSSSSSSSSSSLRRKLRNQRIIPSITMSEYVEGHNAGKSGAVVANSQSLFIPLQLIEPLEPTCDILEGSCLELKVRIRGANAVIWVKENKIIPNTPPDFQYFEEKSDGLYGLRIADVFLEDAGLYICEAYGAGGNEITSWCEVDVIESSPNDDDYINWEDMSEEIRAAKPLVVPVIVTSQAEQENVTTELLEASRLREPSPVHPIPVKEVAKEIKNHSDTPGTTSSIQDDNEKLNKNMLAKASSSVSSSTVKTQGNFLNESVHENNADETSANSKIETQSQKATSTYTEACVETVTEFASANAVRETHYVYPDEINSTAVAATTVAVVVPAEVDQLLINPTGDSLRDEMVNDDGQRKLMSQLSSASDESVSLKEPRSCDEGALSSAEEMSASISIDVKSSVTNDEDIGGATESSGCSPFSEQNGRSSSVDSAIGFLGRPLFVDGKFPPRILMGPSNIISLYGEVVYMRVKVQNYGIPKTAVNWFKFVGGTYQKIELTSGDQSSSQNDAHVVATRCGASLSTLSITNVNYDDCGRYRVKVQNSLGMDSHDCLLTVEGPPEAPTTPPKVKYDDKGKTILIQWSSCPYDGGSKITGYYVEASIIQGSRTAINKEEQDNWQLLTPQSYSWLCYTLTNPKRGCVYRFRVFGENSYGKGKPTDPSLPLLVPVLMEGRRAGSSDALLWSLKSINPVAEESPLRADTKRDVVHEHEIDRVHVEEPATPQEEEPIEYKNVTLRNESFYNLYDKFDELGKGRFGIVFEAIHKESKKSYAGKFVKCIKAKDKERGHLEVKIMNELGYHPKLICLIDAFEMPREIVIVTQRINGGELFERVVADDFTLTEGDCITFLQQICDAVRYIHEKNIMHLDLKPENILCTAKTSNQIKIIDFGLAQYYNSKESIRILFGTAEFVSPEIINYEPIAPSTDNWSIGVITYILLSGLSPFMGDNDNETFSNITRAEFDFEDEAFEKISEEAKDFISNLIVKRPEERMTAEECLNHPWLRVGDDQKKDIVLPTDKLKRFLVRRKWQKTGNAIRALGRMTTLYSSRRSSSTTSTPSGSLSMSISSPPPPATPSRTESLATQDSLDYDNVFISNTSSESQDGCKINLNNNTNNSILPVQVVTKNQNLSNTKSKYSDPSRSDSGVCDVGSFSTSLNIE